MPFPRGISPKVNVIEQLEFELINYDVTVQYICHNMTGKENWMRTVKNF